MTSALSGRRVLVVEDEFIVAWNLEDMLAELGCVVVGPAARIDQALVMIDTGAIDMALLDINLDGLASYPVADALAARSVPYAFTTGYEGDNMRVGYQTSPVLRKPFHPSELVATLTRLLTKDQ